MALELNEFLYEFNAFIRNLKRTNVLKNWELPQITPHSSRVKCFYHCQMEKLEIIANGVVTPFDLKVLNISPESYDKYGVKVKPCLKLSHRDKCELGYLVFQCLKREFNL